MRRHCIQKPNKSESGSLCLVFSPISSTRQLDEKSRELLQAASSPGDWEAPVPKGAATHTETGQASMPHTPEHVDPRSTHQEVMAKATQNQGKTHDTPLETPILLQDFGEDE